MLLGDYMPKCSMGSACTTVMRNYSELYGYLLIKVGMLMFVIVLVVFMINKIIEHVKS